MQDTHFSPIVWKANQLSLIDQRVLPDEEVWLCIQSVESCAQAITDMAVRGAPAIGIAAAYGVVLSCQSSMSGAPAQWREQLSRDIKRLADSRPTAVNLFWALERMQSVLASIDDPRSAFETALAEAHKIHHQDYQMNLAIGEYGASLLADSARVLTHCNTGALATGGHGTALGVIRSAWASGRLHQVYVNETRPWLQGSRLSVWELLREGIPTTLQADSAAALLMQQDKVDWVIVGADRIAANGDSANKIGTYALAVLAKAHGVKFMVAAPTSTIDMSVESSLSIPIEERDAAELWAAASSKPVPHDLGFHNPVFDVTPAHLIDAIVSEKGIVQPSSAGDFKPLFSDWF